MAGIADPIKAAKAREAILALAKDLTAKEPEDRVKALAKIADFGPDANIVGEQVIEAMQDKVGAVKTAAAETLAKINPEVHTHVVAILHGPKNVLRSWLSGNWVPRPNSQFPCSSSATTTSFSGVAEIRRPTCTSRICFRSSVKIAPKDKRFAAAVLSYVYAPNPKLDQVIATVITPSRKGEIVSAAKRDRIIRDRRVAGIAQLNVIDAETSEKVKVLTAALDDNQATLAVIKALQGYGKDAAPALLALKKLERVIQRADPERRHHGHCQDRVTEQIGKRTRVLAATSGSSALRTARAAGETILLGKQIREANQPQSSTNWFAPTTTRQAVRKSALIVVAPVW